MNIAYKLIEYYKTREVKVLGSFSIDDTQNIMVIVTEILSWLKLERKREVWLEQGRRTKNKPLELNMNYPWCKDLAKILEEDNSLAEVFCINDNFLDFKSEISKDYIHESRVVADEKYNPQMIIG